MNTELTRKYNETVTTVPKYTKTKNYPVADYIVHIEERKVKTDWFDRLAFQLFLPFNFKLIDNQGVFQPSDKYDINLAFLYELKPTKDFNLDEIYLISDFFLHAKTLSPFNTFIPLIRFEQKNIAFFTKSFFLFHKALTLNYEHFYNYH